MSKKLNNKKMNVNIELEILWNTEPVKEIIKIVNENILLTAKLLKN